MIDNVFYNYVPCYLLFAQAKLKLWWKTKHIWRKISKPFSVAALAELAFYNSACQQTDPRPTSSTTLSTFYFLFVYMCHVTSDT